MGPLARALAAAAALLEVAAGIGFALSLGWGWRQALDAFLLTNGAMGVSFAICGAVIAAHRSGNPVGWLLVADGLGHATSAAGFPLAEWLHHVGAPVPAQRLVETIASYSWPVSITLFLPLALLLFPDGRGSVLAGDR